MDCPVFVTNIHLMSDELPVAAVPCPRRVAGTAASVLCAGGPEAFDANPALTGEDPVLCLFPSWWLLAVRAVAVLLPTSNLCLRCSGARRGARATHLKMRDPTCKVLFPT